MNITPGLLLMLTEAVIVSPGIASPGLALTLMLPLPAALAVTAMTPKTNVMTRTTDNSFFMIYSFSSILLFILTGFFRVKYTLEEPFVSSCLR